MFNPFCYFLISCGGGSDQSSSGNNSLTDFSGSSSGNLSGESLNTRGEVIVSIAGGEVTIPDKVSINIPAGSISRHTEITLTQVSSDGLIAKKLYSDIIFISSSNRPDTEGNIVLTLYYDSSNGSIEDVEAYAYEESGIIYPVKSVKEGNMVIISNPEIAASISSQKSKINFTAKKKAIGGYVQGRLIT